jgi:hypothetical protein
MNCPLCDKPMKKVSWHITSNHQEGDEYKEYDKTLYQCEKDDAWVETELPKAK